MAEKTRIEKISGTVVPFEELPESTTVLLEVERQTTVVVDDQVEVQTARVETAMTKAGWNSLPRYDRGSRKGQPRFLNARLIAYLNEQGERIPVHA